MYNKKNNNGYGHEKDNDIELDREPVKFPFEPGFCILIHYWYVNSGIKVLDV
jgi:hypothetical protein